MTDITRTVSTALTNLRQRQAASDIGLEIRDRSQEATTGLLADPYKSLGARASDAIAIRMEIERNDGFLTRNALLDGRLSQVESAMNAVRDAGQGVLDIAVSSVESKEATARTLSMIARNALSSITNSTAVSSNGSFLLSGVASDQRPLREWDDATAGPSPRAVIDNVVGGGIGGLADAQAKIDELKAVFDNTTATPGHAFNEAFYGGAAESVTTRLSENERIDQGARADDPAMRDLLRGLAMLDSVDVTQIDDTEAYQAWMGEAVAAMSSGLAGITDLSVEAGRHRARVADTMAAQESRQSFLNTERLELEGVDQYDAAARLTLLQSQLEANYAITARLSRLSFLNFL